MDRRQIASLLVLNELGAEPILSTFSDRLVLQKTIYLAQAAGIDLGYYYGWYLRGPYCSDVADDFFGAQTDPKSVEEVLQEWTLDEGSKSKLQRVSVLLDSRPGGSSSECRPLSRPRWLELLASVHYLVVRKQVSTDEPRELAKKLREFNKQFDESEVECAVKQLKSVELLNAI